MKLPWSNTHSREHLHPVDQDDSMLIDLFSVVVAFLELDLDEVAHAFGYTSSDALHSLRLLIAKERAPFVFERKAMQLAVALYGYAQHLPTAKGNERKVSLEWFYHDHPSLLRNPRQSFIASGKAHDELLHVINT